MTKLLIVDDDDALVRAFERGLKYDYDVRVAFSLSEAQDKIESVDALLTDWHIGADTPLPLLGRRPTVIVTALPDVPASTIPVGTPKVGAVLCKPAEMDDIKAALAAVIAKG